MFPECTRLHGFQYDADANYDAMVEVCDTALVVETWDHAIGNC